MRYRKLQKRTGTLRDAVMAYETVRKPLGNRKLTANDMCTIAFGNCHRRTFLAERFDVSKQTIRRALSFTALTVLEIQLHQLKDLRDFVLTKSPDFSAASLSWDETSQILALDSMETSDVPVHRHQTSSSWEVMVSKLQLTVGWVTGLKLYHEFVMPPLPLASNSSSSLWLALFKHPLTGPVLGLAEDVLRASKLSTWIHETDGHLANEKLHFHLYDQRSGGGQGDANAPLPCLMEQVLCQNHQIQLSMVAAVDSLVKVESTGGKIVPNLFCSTLFLRMGGHFVRLLSSVQLLVKEATFLHWVPCPTSEQLLEGRLYNQELISYLIDNLRHGSREMSASQPGVGLGYES